MSHYSTAHQNPKGEGDDRPTALQIVEDEKLIGQLPDKVFLVTGVSNGIGIETMRALYATGAHIFGTVRDLEKGRKVVHEVEGKTKGGKITLIEMDNRSLSSVKKAAESFLRQSKTLNVFIANAGIVGVPEGKTVDGFEDHFQTNYLAHFYLFQLLKDVLLTSSTAEHPSRVVSVSSIGHRCGPVRQDYNFEKEAYNSWQAYGQSKTATIYFANEIERQYGSRGLHATSLHPGVVMTFKQEQKGWEDPDMQRQLKNAEQGAATTIYAALSEEWKDKGGMYLSNCVVQGPTQHPENPFHIGDDGHESWAYDEQAEKKLWKDSLRMIQMFEAR